MTRARDVSKIFTTAASISDLDARIIISSASPATGNNNGRLWIDVSTASAPVIQTFSSNSFNVPRLSKQKATGGVITTSGSYTIHTFLSSGNFFANSSLDIEYLVVAGGGAGGSGGYGGGGGAGGYRTASTSVAGGTSLSAVVGSGGSNATSNNVGSNGNDSVFAGTTSSGGGGGGSSLGNGLSGGSGGGGGTELYKTAGSGIVGQGNNGGAGPAG